MGEPNRRVSPQEARSFGLQLAGALVLIGVAFRWRGHEVIALVLWVAGSLLAVAGIFAPKKLDSLIRLWNLLSRLLARVMTPIILFGIYFVVITPMSAVMRLLGRNPLSRDTQASSYWVSRDEAPERGERMKRQF